MKTHNLELIQEYARKLRLSYMSANLPELIFKAQEDKPTYLDFINQIFCAEIQHRDQKDYQRRFKAAKLPLKYDLDAFDFKSSNGITVQQLKELRDLIWLENCYNIVLMGPPGTGKTFIASGLIYEAIKNGKKAYVYTMEDLINILKVKELSSITMGKYKKIIQADLIAIDDIMTIPLQKNEAVAFFNFINTLHEKIPIIITTNKAPTEWAKTLDDEVLATALLDRLLYRCEVIKLQGTSYRIENRKTIFNNNQ